MSAPSTPPNEEGPKLGDRIRFRHSAGLEGRIVELRGPLGPGGVQIYRIRISRKPTPAYTEVRADQFDVLPESE